MASLLTLLSSFSRQGRNVSGQVGLFPQSYTSIFPSSIESPIDPTLPTFLSLAANPSSSLQPLPEESESQAHTPSSAPHPPLNVNGHHSHANGSNTNVNGNTNDDQHASGDPAPAEGEMMKVTMTDVQKALEQLGRANHDHDGNRSFSFASGQDTENDTETDTDFETDNDKGEDWHKGARRKLAEKARRAVEEAEKLEMMMNGLGSPRTVAPPIEFELSEESESEEDDTNRHTKKYEMARQHPYIPEEDEDAEEDASTHAVLEEQSASAVQQRLDSAELVEVPIRDSTDLPTATVIKSSFLGSPTPMPSIGPQEPSTIDLNGAVGITPPATRSSTVPRPPDWMANQSIAPSPTPVAVPLQIQSNPQSPGLPPQNPMSPVPVSTPTSTLIGQQDALTTSSEVEKNGEQKRHPSDWTVEEVVEWLASKGFGQDVCEKFIGAFS